MEPEVHIAGLLVHTVPDQRKKLAKSIAGLPRTEVSGSARAGKLVVICECDSEADLLALISAIRDMPGVLNVALVYQHSESAQAMEEEVVTDEADSPRIH